MTDEFIRPLDSETVNAIEATAKLGQEILKTAQQNGGYMVRVFGKLPDNLLGFLIVDWVAL